ncbi:BET1-like protein [Anneissia japonica]|uniref:BET1-like protein n=1 Tax=Anneissia japonica TaxID=1529436 RepID=UPI0014254EDD|nr:BET1-like protein [Anneissia japonica]XP_033126945.1 BET1-like protein [Anneissia japonica]
MNRNGGGRGAASTEDMLESENNRLSENLASKVSTLKSLALDIESETNDQNRYLDGMDGEFDSTHGLLGGTVKRFDQMLKSGKHNRRLMCYLILTLLFLFVLFYMLIGHVTGG